MSTTPQQKQQHGAHAARPEEPPSRTAERPSDLLVPLVDRTRAGVVYDPSMLWLTLLGAAVGLLILGVAAFAIATGRMPVAGLGQMAAGGFGPAVVAGAAVGAALGGLIGGLIACRRLPPALSGESAAEPER